MTSAAFTRSTFTRSTFTRSTFTRSTFASRTLKTLANVFRRHSSSHRTKRRRNARFCPLITNTESEPFKHAIQQLASLHLTPESTSSVEEKIDGIESLGHLSWTGGTEVAEFAGRKYLFVIVSMMEDVNTPDSLKIQIIKSVSEICYGLKRNQDLARELSLLTVVIEYGFSTMYDETRKWCLHALFFLLCNNTENQKCAIENPKFRECVRNGLEDKWSGWEHNEAAELNAMTNVCFE